MLLLRAKAHKEEFDIAGSFVYPLKLGVVMFNPLFHRVPATNTNLVWLIIELVSIQLGNNGPVPETPGSNHVNVPAPGATSANH